jgi:hypothetical protein
VLAAWHSRLQKVVLTLPTLLCLVGFGAGSVDEGVDFGSVVRPVCERSLEELWLDACGVGDERHDLAGVQVGLGFAGGSNRADDLPHVRAADESSSPARWAVAKDDHRILLHPKGLIHQPIAGAG